MTINGKNYKEGAVITLNGTRGYVYEGKLDMIDATENPNFQRFMRLVDKHRKLGVRANADTPKDAKVARDFGAEGIGLFRTEHMFYGEKSEKPLFLLRQMILSSTLKERKKALKKLFTHVKRDVKGTMEAMSGLPVTFRLLDPPLHEFIPQDPKKQKELASSLGITVNEIKRRGELLHEVNPMMGHRGVRLGITYPEVTEMQIRAIFEAAVEVNRLRKKALPEIMIPVTCDVNELEEQKIIVERVYREVLKKFKIRSIKYLLGTMIEIPRACLLADEMAGTAQFFSFGTNDLTQMGFGFSRDDIGEFLGEYLDKKILDADPFQTIDQKGIGQLIEMGVNKGRLKNKDLKVGICGEQGGDPASVDFCHRVGMNYVSCSPYRVPIARLAAAHAVLGAVMEKKKSPKRKTNRKKRTKGNK
jgi:pyruvate,orthophosphate dikinase